MTVWEQLGIERTKDKRKIKRAYAKQAAKYHPEEHPEEFKELYEAYQSALSYADRPAFDEAADAFDLEELINATSSSQPQEQEEEESRIDFSAFSADMDVSAKEELIQMRLINRILQDMQTIIEKSEKGIARESFKIFLDTVIDKQLEEWKNLLASPDFRKVRNDRNFIVKLNELECISLLSGDMAACLYRELALTFIESGFERTDYQELKFKLQQCIDRGVKRKQKAERRELRFVLACAIIMIVILDISVAVSVRLEKQNSEMKEQAVNETYTLLQEKLQEKYHQEFEVERHDRGKWTDYRYLSESLDFPKYQWFSGVALEGDMAGHECTIAWKEEEGIRDSFAYELIEEYRQECDALNDFECERRPGDGYGWGYCGYEYKKDGMIYNSPIYDVCNSHKKKRAYSKKEMQQLKKWIHKIQNQDAFFVQTPYIKLLFRGLHGEEYVLKLTQDDKVDYHKLMKKLEQFSLEGKKKEKSDSEE